MQTTYRNTAATSVDATLSEDPASYSLNHGAHAAEHCAIDPASLAALDSELRRQVLLRPAAGPVALYTVTEHVDGSTSAAHVGTDGLARLGNAAPPPLAATIETAFTGGDPKTLVRLTEELRGAEARGLAILAPHGGKIEEGTDVQAELVHDALAQQGKPVRAWIARGFNPSGAHTCWHITSSEISEHSFPMLGTLFGPDGAFAHAVAFHGHGGSDIIVGGGIVPDAGHPELKEALRARIQSVVGTVVVRIKTSGPLAGALPSNIVNRITTLGNGIQIEQPLAVRLSDEQRDAVARAVAEVYADLI